MSANSGGVVGANKRHERTRKKREAGREEKARPNSTEDGGVLDSVVAGCNHGDSATKRKRIQPQIFLIGKRNIFEFGKSKESKRRVGKRREK